jgi:hypothetical protein
MQDKYCGAENLLKTIMNLPPIILQSLLASCPNLKEAEQCRVLLKNHDSDNEDTKILHEKINYYIDECRLTIALFIIRLKDLPCIKITNGHNANGYMDYIITLEPEASVVTNMSEDKYKEHLNIIFIANVFNRFKENRDQLVEDISKLPKDILQSLFNSFHKCAEADDSSIERKHCSYININSASSHKIKDRIKYYLEEYDHVIILFIIENSHHKCWDNIIINNFQTMQDKCIALQDKKVLV